MTRDNILEKIKDFEDAGNNLLSFYVTYREAKNIKSQKWGMYYDLDNVLDRIEESSVCIEGELPIVRLIIYSEQQCLVFAENKLWNCVEDESDYSHVCLTVPYISKNGMFGEIVCESE